MWTVGLPTLKGRHPYISPDQTASGKSKPYSGLTDVTTRGSTLLRAHLNLLRLKGHMFIAGQRMSTRLTTTTHSIGPETTTHSPQVTSCFRSEQNSIKASADVMSIIC